MRQSGILMPVFSLPSKFGIGAFDREAFSFVDFLEKSSQRVWQVLPLGPTGYGNSPYQPVSAFAGNPYYISLEKLIEKGYLTWDECNSCDFGNNQEKVDYGALYFNRKGILCRAKERFFEKIAGDKGLKDSFDAFVKKEEYWLKDYALFCVIKDINEGKPWYEWEDKLKKRDAQALNQIESEHKDEIELIYFEQFIFDEQWNELHEYAAKKKVSIIGDMPFYVSLDSTDIWQHPDVFQLDKDLLPKVVAGCPPDAFSEKGQMWGNPIYDWKETGKGGYAWWMSRMRRNAELFDVIRIDHFHGFAEYYAIPYGAEDATKGKSEKGPGMLFFDRLRKELGDISLIAEDLGNVTKENEALLEESEIPGMKVLQYAFTSWDSKYLTHRHDKNCVVYTGTHDNTPTRAWVEEIGEGHREFTRRYINSRNTDFGGMVWDFIREAYHSPADLCIVPLQDYLVKGREARINTPGTLDGNWEWRLIPNYLSDALAGSIKEMVETYGRTGI